MKKINEEEKEKQSVAWSAIYIYIGSAALGFSATVVNWDLYYWAWFVGIGAVIFIVGILLASYPIKKAHARQKEIKNYAIYSRTEDLLLHLSELKLSLVANERQIEKNTLLKNHYECIISKIEFARKEIEAELNKEKGKE